MQLSSTDRFIRYSLSQPFKNQLEEIGQKKVGKLPQNHPEKSGIS
jgi:hypothetical protein